MNVFAFIFVLLGIILLVLEGYRPGLSPGRSLLAFGIAAATLGFALQLLITSNPHQIHF